jgi:hypothetical protein
MRCPPPQLFCPSPTHRISEITLKTTSTVRSSRDDDGTLFE